MLFSRGSARRRRAESTLLILALVAPVSLTGGCGPGVQAGRVRSDPPGPVERPGISRLSPAGVIDALDVALLPDGTELLVWQSRVALTSDSPRVELGRRAAGAASWGAPREIPDARAPLRLVAGATRAHLLAGADLRHWVSSGGGVDWTPAVSGLPPGNLVLGFDALAEPTGVRVVALVRTSGADDGERRLVTWLVDDAGGSAPALIGQFSAVSGDPAGPVVARRGASLAVAVGLNRLETRNEQRNGRPVEVTRGAARLLTFVSADGGQIWHDAGSPAPPAGEMSQVQSVALTATPRGWTLACGANGLYLAEWSAGASWSTLQHVAAYRTGLSGGSATTEVRLLASAESTQAYWVDERYRASDRKPWNPLGGFPWSDAPEWANNDLFTLGWRPSVGGEGLRRLTPELSRTDRVAVASAGPTRLLAWAGRHRVGKRVDSAGEAPELFLMRIVSSQ